MNADILLSAQDLSVRFGGVLAVNKVSFDVKRGEVFTLIGPNGAGKTTVFNLISRIYTPTTGVIDYAGPQGTVRLTDQAPHQIAGLGIARTFQNIELFEHATVLQNLLIGRHTHRKTGLWSEMFFTGKARAVKSKPVRKSRKSSNFWTCNTTATRWWRACLMACAKWSSWPAPCAPSLSCCCWTSHRRA